MSKFRFSINYFRRIAAATAVVSFILVGLGGYVRGTDAGLSCPDWPLCYGRIVPHTLGEGIAQEVGHRYLASLVSLGVMSLSFLSYFNRKLYPRLWDATRLMLLGFAIQVLLGGLTVLLLLNPFIVTAHLGLGTFFFQLMAVLALDQIPSTEKGKETIVKISRRFTKPSRSKLSAATLVLLVAICAQILLGGFVGSSGAALACPDIPFCFGSLWPEFAAAPQFVHMLHRLLGVSIVVLAVYMTLRFRRLSDWQEKRRGHLAGIAILSVVQACLGFANVYFQIPVWSAVIHLLLAQLILLSTLIYYRRITKQISVYTKADWMNSEVEETEIKLLPKKRYSPY